MHSVRELMEGFPDLPKCNVSLMHCVSRGCSIYQAFVIIMSCISMIMISALDTRSLAVYIFVIYERFMTAESGRLSRKIRYLG